MGTERAPLDAEPAEKAYNSTAPVPHRILCGAEPLLSTSQLLGSSFPHLVPFHARHSHAWWLCQDHVLLLGLPSLKICCMLYSASRTHACASGCPQCGLAKGVVLGAGQAHACKLPMQALQRTNIDSLC